MFKTARIYATWCAHFFKALTKHHHQHFDPIFRAVIPEDGCVVDVGAHAGYFVKRFIRFCPRGRVMAVEPGKYARSILTPVVKILGMKQVEILPIALSDKEGEATLSAPIKASGSLGFGLSRLNADWQGRANVSHTVKMTTLDTLAPEKVNFIKADIEGYEGRFLTGAKETLKKHKPALLLELDDDRLKDAGDSLRGVWQMLEELGYKAYTLDNGKLAPAPVANHDHIFFLQDAQREKVRV